MTKDRKSNAGCFRFWASLEVIMDWVPPGLAIIAEQLDNSGYAAGKRKRAGSGESRAVGMRSCTALAGTRPGFGLVPSILDLNVNNPFYLQQVTTV